MTAVVLCAFNATQTSVHQRVNFLTCWDDAEGSIAERGEKCAVQAGLDWQKISQCSKAPEANQLQTQAAKDFAARYPSHTKPGGMFGVPALEINGKSADDTSFKSLLTDLCATGITAPACKSDVVLV